MRALRGPVVGAVRANLTPLIDVVFLLIIFFMLVAQMTRQRALELELPRLADAQAIPMDEAERIVISVVPRHAAASSADAFRIDGEPFPPGAAGATALADVLRARREQAPAVAVTVRAAFDEPYDRVHPALRAAALAGIDRVELVTLDREDGA